MSKIFVDTNILVSSLYNPHPSLKKKARLRLKELETRNHGVISTQVLQEFYVVATRKLGIEALLAKQIVQRFESFEVVTISPVMIYAAIDCSITAQISFWDALIVITAEISKCQFIWTEDLNPGQVIRGVRVINPLIS
jgi:predicted nucleic acid-binding protein